MSKRDNHYATADEKFVKRVILYGKVEDPDDDQTANALYYDKNFENPVYNDEVEDLFLDGAIIRFEYTPGCMYDMLPIAMAMGMMVGNVEEDSGVLFKGTDRTEE